MLGIAAATDYGIFLFGRYKEAATPARTASRRTTPPIIQ